MKTTLLFIIAISLIGCSQKKRSSTISIPEILIQQDLGEICLQRISEIKSSEDDIYDPIGIEQYKKLIYQAKTHPIWMVQEPKYNDTDLKIIKAHRARFEKANPWLFLISDTNRKFYQYRPDVGREVFLRNGYLYHPDPGTAHVIAQLVNLEMLTNRNEVLINRGSLLMTVERKNKNFFYKDGPYKGRIASISFLDRIIDIDDEMPEPMHIDLGLAKNDYLFDKIIPEFVSESHVVADVWYNNSSTKTLFNKSGTKLKLQCELNNNNSIRESRAFRFSSVYNLKKVMLEQVMERVPFDEPKYEVRQEDGNLRDAWRSFFYRGRLSYQYTNERMTEVNRIYDHLGNPIPPQVCVDFLVDSIDRAAGSWYTSVNQRSNPGKTSGKFNSSELSYKDESGDNQYYSFRNITGFTRFANDYPQWFDVIEIKDKVKIGSTEFFEYMQSLNLLEGDMVFIKGPVPWDRKEHAHSFYIYQNDPVSGMPSLLAGNAGTASLRPWKIEANRTRNRYIFRIIRFKNVFLKFFVE